MTEHEINYLRTVNDGPEIPMDADEDFELEYVREFGEALERDLAARERRKARRRAAKQARRRNRR